MRTDINRDVLFGQNASEINKAAFGVLARLDGNPERVAPAAALVLLAIAAKYGLSTTELLDAAARWRRDGSQHENSRAIELWIDGEL